MPVIAMGVMQRIYRSFGMFLATDWRRFCRLIGVKVRFRREVAVPAFRVERTIVIRRGMSVRQTLWWIWHELGHILLHPMNALAPLGRPLRVKQERQADQFAALFPIWDVPDLTWEASPSASVVSWDWESERSYLKSLWGGGI